MELLEKWISHFEWKDAQKLIQKRLIRRKTTKYYINAHYTNGIESKIELFELFKAMKRWEPKL